MSGSILIMDNYYNSISLTNDLTQQNIGVVGTVRYGIQQINKALIIQTKCFKLYFNKYQFKIQTRKNESNGRAKINDESLKL